MKHSVLTLLTACAAGSAFAGASREKIPDTRPNIVFIYTDDLDFDETELSKFYSEDKYPSYTGAKKRGFTSDWGRGLYDDHVYDTPLLTPNIRSLAEEGRVFNRFYVTATLCVPSRYTLLTGQHASRSPEYTPLVGPTAAAPIHNESALAPQQWIFPKAMQEAGYATGLVGKWHLHPRFSGPERGVMDPPISQADAKDPRVADLVAKTYQRGVDFILQNYGFDYAGGIYHENPSGLGIPKELIGSHHHMEWQTYHALEFIDQYHEQPFFLYFAPTIPHGCLTAKFFDDSIEATPEGYTTKHIGAQPSRADLNRRIEENGIELRNSMATWLDDGIGALLKKLDDYGLRDNTLIIFTSDQQSRGKFSCNEGTHVPFVARWPQQFSGGSRCDQLLANVDIAPTLLALSGGNPQTTSALDGLDLSGCFLPKPAKPVERDLLLETGYARAVVSKHWKYIALRIPPEIINATEPAERPFISYNGEIWRQRPDGRLKRGLKTGTPVLSQNPDQGFPHYRATDQLFNLETDPYEQVNLAGDPAYADKLNEMKQKLTDELQKLPRTFAEFTTP